jgi:hypothetical protein
MLRGENCDSGQGFLFARPLDVAAIEKFLEDWAQENATPALGLPRPLTQVATPTLWLAIG